MTTQNQHGIHKLIIQADNPSFVLTVCLRLNTAITKRNVSAYF